jgi:catechol 2,3-dioxygenase-like lactoylglutathione lyase family enzyme
MLDHLGFGVSDHQRSKAFYEQALAPLEITLLMEPKGQSAGFGNSDKPFFWLQARPPAVEGGVVGVIDGAQTRRPIVCPTRGRRPRCCFRRGRG